jgi:hypothetical protein
MDHEPSSPLLNNEDLRHIALWAADCAERALPVFETKAPNATRPREAITAIRALARSRTRTAKLRKVACAASAAAREVGDPDTAAARCRAAGDGQAGDRGGHTFADLKDAAVPAAAEGHPRGRTGDRLGVVKTVGSKTIVFAWSSALAWLM